MAYRIRWRKQGFLLSPFTHLFLLSRDDGLGRIGRVWNWTGGQLTSTITPSVHDLHYTHEVLLPLLPVVLLLILATTTATATSATATPIPNCCLHSVRGTSNDLVYYYYYFLALMLR